MDIVLGGVGQVGYRIEEEEKRSLNLPWNGGKEEVFDKIAKEILEEEEYEAAYLDRQDADDMHEDAFLAYLSDELEVVHGNRHPFREYSIMFSADEPLAEEEFLTDVRDAIRWRNNVEGKLKVDPRSRRAAYELYVGAVWLYGSAILGYVAAVMGSGLSYPTFLGAAGMGLIAHGKYKQEHLPSYEMGHNIEDKLSLEELESDMADEVLYELAYKVRTKEAYNELIKNDAAALCRAPGFVKSMTWDQLAYIGTSAARGAKEKAPVVREKSADFWNWLRSEDFSSAHTLNT